MRCKENDDVERLWDACKETTTQTYALMQRNVLVQITNCETQINDDVEKSSCEKSGSRDAHRTWMRVQCWMARNGWDKSAKHGHDGEAQETRPY